MSDRPTASSVAETLVRPVRATAHADTMVEPQRLTGGTLQQASTGPRPMSGGALTAFVPSTQTAHSRYESGDILGVGGMGEVRRFTTG